MSSKNPSSDPTLSQFKQNMVSDWYVYGEHSGEVLCWDKRIKLNNDVLEKAAGILLDFMDLSNVGHNECSR